MGFTLADLTEHDRDLMRTVVHEAGHAVAATVLGGRVYAAVVSRSKRFGVSGRILYDDLPDHAAAATFYGGPWCEARWLGGRNPDMRGLVSALGRNSSDAKQVALSSEGTVGARLTAEPLLQRCWPSVITLAQKLLRDGEARHDDVCRALGLTDGGGPGSFELALIRSGQAPSTFTVTRGLAG